MEANPDRRKRRKRLVLAFVLVAVLVVAGFAIYFVYEQAVCGPLGCGAIDYPVIQHAQAITSLGEGNCQFESASAISWATVCSVYVNGGNSGTITLTVANHGNEGGGSRIDFAVYSSEPQYINFTAIPTCAYTTAPPLNDANACLLSGNSPQSFQFAFAVSQSYGTSSLRENVSVTVVMYQTCCFA